MEKVKKLQELLDTFKQIQGNFVINGVAIDEDLSSLIDIKYAKYCFLSEMRNIIRDELNKSEIKKNRKRIKLTPKNRLVVIKKICEFIISKEGVHVDEFYSRSLDRNVAFARQVAVYLAKKITGEKLSVIGKKIIGRHHTTVIYSIKKIEGLVEVDKEIKNKVESYYSILKEMLN